jgi:hypothetical protein
MNQKEKAKENIIMKIRKTEYRTCKKYTLVDATIHYFQDKG